MEPSVYLLKNDEQISWATVQAVLNQFGEDVESVAVIGEFEDKEKVKAQRFDNLSQYLLHIYRMLRLHKNERQTVYSSEDQLLAIQLCMADYNREKHDFFDVATSEVLATSDQLIQDTINGPESSSNSVSESASPKDEYKEVARCYSEFLNTCNSTDLATALCHVKGEFLKSEEVPWWSKSKCVVLHWPINIIEASFLALLCHKSGHYFKTTAEIPVTEDTPLMPEKVTISTEKVALPSCDEMFKSAAISSCSTPRVSQLTSQSPAMPRIPKPTASLQKNLSATETYFKRVFISYLTLVVNTRDELALARCFNVPDRELDHEAFTALKREAKQKNMPMCQTATSYVMKIRLGGKGYMPDSSCQIAQYVRGLSDFVSLIQKLQVIVEEEINPSTGLLRLINQIKMAFLKAKNIGCKKEVIERVVRYLKLSVGKLRDGQCLDTPQKSVGNGGSMAGAKVIKLLRKLLDQEASRLATRRSIDVLCDGMASQGTPVRLPSLLSMFRSPAILSPDSPENQSLAERLLQRETGQVGLKRMGYRSCMMWADPDDLQNEQCVNNDYLRAIANDNTQRTPRNEWKDTIWADNDNNHSNKQDQNNSNEDTILDMIDNVTIQEQCNNVKNMITAGETPKGRGKTKRQPFREINEQNIMKKAKNDKPIAKKKKKTIQQVKGQKTLSSFFRV